MSKITQFYKKHPALIYAVFFLLGLGFVKSYDLSFLLPFVALSFPVIKQDMRKLMPMLAVFLLALFYGHFTKETFPSNQNTLDGTAFFEPCEVKWQSTHFKKTKIVRGKIVYFLGEMEKKAKNISCSIPLSSSDPSMNCSFYIHGVLEKKDTCYTFKPDPNTEWIPVPYTYSWTEKRFQAKEQLGKKIHKIFLDTKVADFMKALTLGTLEDRMLKFEFGRLGLQHILAISGFHFGLFAWFLGLFFRLFLPKKGAYIALFISLTSYYLLLGNSPSVLRAYLAISLYLVGKLGNFRSTGLNLLGVALFLEILLDPQVISHLGFQLSFLATFAILFFLPISRTWMEKLLPLRTLDQITNLSPLERVIYFSSSFLRSGFALNIAVTLWTLPVGLFHFHTFPLVSIFYNLLIPLGFSLSLFLFFLSLPFFLLFPPIASALTSCNEVITAKILQIIFQSPLLLHLSFNVPPFPVFLVFCILLLFFFFSFQKNSREPLQFREKKIC